MGLLTLPKFIAIDSSSLGRMADDFWSGNADRRKRVATTLQQLSDSAWIIVVTFEHIQELIQHEDKAVALNRLKFVRQLPHVAKLKTINESFAGTTFDVDCREIDAILRHGLRLPDQIVQHVRADFWDYVTGEELVGDVSEFWEMMHLLSSRLLERSKEVASIVRSGDPAVLKTKLKDIPRKKFPGRKQAKSILSNQASEMEARLDQHGDERLQDTQGIAQDFYKELAGDLGRVVEDGGDPFSGIIRHFGLREEDVHDDMTVGDLGDLAVFVKILEKAGRRLQMQSSPSLTDVPPNTCPSWSLKLRLRQLQNSECRVKGSDIIDTHLAVLLLYADAVQVDKRTAENLRKIKSSKVRKDFKWLPERHFKASHYSLIPELASAFQ